MVSSTYSRSQLCWKYGIYVRMEPFFFFVQTNPAYWKDYQLKLHNCKCFTVSIKRDHFTVSLTYRWFITQLDSLKPRSKQSARRLHLCSRNRHNKIIWEDAGSNQKQSRLPRPDQMIQNLSNQARRALQSYTIWTKNNNNNKKRSLLWLK